MFKYPNSDLDHGDRILSLLGSFWSQIYQGRDLAEQFSFARGQLTAQTFRNLMEYLATKSRFEIPVFHKEQWHFLELLESQINDASTSLAKYDGEFTYDPAGSLKYGEPVDSEFFAFPLPSDLHDVKLILNRISAPSLTWVRGVDYLIDKSNEAIVFRSNPFDTSLLPKRETLEDGVVTDSAVGLWLFRGDFDWQYVYSHFGYILNLRLQSSEYYKELVNAILDAIVEGTSARDVQNAFAAISGIPIVKESSETVENIITDHSYKWVITDSHAYRFSPETTITVSDNQKLVAGQTMSDGLRFYEFNRGELSDEISALSMGKGFLGFGFYGDLVFENSDVSLDVTENYEGSGYTRVEFDLGGYPGDVEKFWDDVHEAGVAAGETLAHLLDLRQSSPDLGEPKASDLPSTINPLEFLVENVLRNNAFLVVVKPSEFSDLALGSAQLALLRKIVPPPTAIIVLIELSQSDEPVILDEVGLGTGPGYDESLTPYVGLEPFSETIDPGSMVTESVRVRLIGGRCK